MKRSVSKQLKYLSKLKAFGQAEKAQYRATLLKVQSSRRAEFAREKAARRRRSQEQSVSSRDLIAVMP